jgi:16S rRNA (cytosine1402-N4)-methyltransferase
MGIGIRDGPERIMDIERIHTPVMLERTVELLAPAIQAEGAVLVDATLGMGGHSRAFLERFPKLTVIGLDRDTDALAIARERLAPFKGRARFVHTVYDGIADAAQSEGFDEVQGVLFDLGVSSLQLDRAERGFAYSKDAPLDMRMDSTRGRTAADVIAESSEEELRRLFYEYGEEKLAPRYARAIVQARAEGPITRSGQLVAIITKATPVAVQRQGHPAKRVFQALRIEVNEELTVLQRAIPAALDTMAVGGRMVVLAYQSLEDRIVKRALQAAASSSAPAGLPMELPEHRAQFRLLVRGAELASESEQAENPRAKPVRLRAVERVRRPS